MEKNNTFKIQ